jgi:hypothetical protein
VVFGLPVVALAIWGPLLGPRDWQRWSTVLQALLTGWIIYVNLGLLIEPIIRRRLTGDLLVILGAISIYLWSLGGMALLLATGRFRFGPAIFWLCVALLCAWNALGWLRLTRLIR